MRNIKKMNKPNDGTRTLMESVMVPEVVEALRDWKNNAPMGVLLGGLALSHYSKPRYTSDVDILYLTEQDIPQAVSGFKRHRPDAFEHQKTGVEIEVLTHSFLNIPFEVAARIQETAIESDGIKVASASGLVASKLFRFNAQDRADIIALIKCAKIDISTFSLPREQISRFIIALADSETDSG